MNKAAVGPLLPKLKVPLNPRKRLRSSEGPWGRINKLRKTVTALVQYERLELYYPRADEARGYAERLISEAIRHGDTHEPTMELADFWLLKKELVHKLFKVLVPRFQNFEYSYTKMYRGPNLYPKNKFQISILELKNNPFPSLVPKTNNRLYLHNILLDAARYDYRKQKNLEDLSESSSDEDDPPLVTNEKEETS